MSKRIRKASLALLVLGAGLSIYGFQVLNADFEPEIVRGVKPFFDHDRTNTFRCLVAGPVPHLRPRERYRQYRVNLPHALAIENLHQELESKGFKFDHDSTPQHFRATRKASGMFVNIYIAKMTAQSVIHVTVTHEPNAYDIAKAWVRDHVPVLKTALTSPRT